MSGDEALVHRVPLGGVAERDGAALGERADERAHPLLRPRYKAWLVFVLLLVTIFNFADRAILAVLSQPIKEELRLTDTDLGILQGFGFAIFYSLLGIPLGMMAERVSRTRLIAVCVGLWSLMTAACGLATSFTTLLLGRVGVGIGEAGVQPSTSSLLADHYRPHRRGSILAIVTLGSPFGFLLGQSLGGWVASQWGWRAAFYALGVPGMVVAMLAWLTLREPPRGLADGRTTALPAPSLGKVVRYLAAKPTYLHLLAGSTLSSLSLTAIANFVLPFYLRGFGMPLAVVGALFGLVSFTSNGLGMLVGGFGVDWLARKDSRWALWAPALALLLCIPAYAGAFLSERLATSLACVWLGNFVLITYFAPTAATMQNLVGPRMRATSTAISALVGGLIGAGLGPTLLGIASDFFAKRAYAGADFFGACPGGRAPQALGSAADTACLAASTAGLRLALISMLVMFVWAAIHYLLASRHLPADLYDAREEA